MELILEIYKSLAFLYTQTKTTVLCLEECSKNASKLNEITFEEDFYNNPGFTNLTSAILSNYCLIQFKSFLDEYKNFNEKYIGDDYAEVVRKIRIKNKYGIDRIKKWKDLEKFRNDILAHNFKNNKKSFFNNPDNQVYEYFIPNSLNEKKVFLRILQKICLNILMNSTMR